MPNLKTIKQSMENLGISQEIINDIMLMDADSIKSEDVVAVIERMNCSLAHEQCLAIIEREGCCKSGKRDKDCKKYAKDNKDKSLTEKLEDISGIQHMGNPKLNDDGTITTGIYWLVDGSYNCACPTIKKLKIKGQPISSIYCGCCAGHFMYHYQNILGLKLRLKEIKSCPISDNGEKPCEFVYEIIKS